MPRTLDSISHSHALARARIARGQSPWAHHVPLKALGQKLRSERDRDRMTEDQAAAACQAIADLLKARLPASWFDITSEHYDRTLDELHEALDGTTAAEFADGTHGTAVAYMTDTVDALYGWADHARVWLGD